MTHGVQHGSNIAGGEWGLAKEEDQQTIESAELGVTTEWGSAE